MDRTRIRTALLVAAPLMVATVVSLLLGAGDALAQNQGGRARSGSQGGFGGPPPGGGPGGMGGPGRMPPFPVLRALDADNDGTLSAKEIANASAALKKLDKNKDGKLTQDEMRPEFGPGGGGPGGMMGGPGGGMGGPPNPATMVNQIFASDKNKDGKLTKAELPAQMQGLFSRADTNHDNAITRAELTAFFSKMGPPPGGGPGGMGGPGGEFDGPPPGGF